MKRLFIDLFLIQIFSLKAYSNIIDEEDVMNDYVQTDIMNEDLDSLKEKSLEEESVNLILSLESNSLVSEEDNYLRLCKIFKLALEFCSEEGRVLLKIKSTFQKASVNILFLFYCLFQSGQMLKPVSSTQFSTVEI